MRQSLEMQNLALKLACDGTPTGEAQPGATTRATALAHVGNRIPETTGLGTSGVSEWDRVDEVDYIAIRERLREQRASDWLSF